MIDSLANNEDSLSLNLSIDLILEQFTKILYRDSCNRVEQLIFTRLFHENELILLIDLNCAYLVSDKLSSDSNSLVVDSIKLSSVVQSFDCVDHQVNEFL